MFYVLVAVIRLPRNGQRFQRPSVERNKKTSALYMGLIATEKDNAWLSRNAITYLAVDDSSLNTNRLRRTIDTLDPELVIFSSLPLTIFPQR